MFTVMNRPLHSDPDGYRPSPAVPRDPGGPRWSPMVPSHPQPSPAIPSQTLTRNQYDTSKSYAKHEFSGLFAEVSWFSEAIFAFASQPHLPAAQQTHFRMSSTCTCTCLFVTPLEIYLIHDGCTHETANEPPISSGPLGGPQGPGGSPAVPSHPQPSPAIHPHTPARPSLEI